MSAPSDFGHRDRCAISGIGATPFSSESGRSALSLAVERHGAHLVASGAVAASPRAAHSQLALVDGTVGVVFVPAGRLAIAVKLTVSEDRRITAMEIIADPERLRTLRLAVLPD